MALGTPAQQKLAAQFFDPFFNWDDDGKLREWLREQDPDALEQFLDWFDFTSRRDRQALGRQELRRLRATAGEKSMESVNWISAADAVALLKPAMTGRSAQMAICARAHAGLVRAKARRFMMGDKSRDNCEIPKEFWWAEGHEALEQNWITGDFETWLEKKIHLRAFGVSFDQVAVEELMPKGTAMATASPSAPIAAGGRPKADWWDDLWVEMCRMLYVGDLKPQRQADIEKAMMDWLSNHDQTASTSTIRPRAAKLWRAISAEDKN